MTRTVVLHYHLFKNAGTSLDQILKQNFGDAWVTREFSMMGGDNSAALRDWIVETPEARAYSTHTALGPTPQIEGVTIISVMLLRDPIDRIRSAYKFERKQEADTLGARLAKAHDLDGYVRERLAVPKDRQCRDFHTHRLASLVPGDGDELARAKAGMAALSVVGRVERFEAFLADLGHALGRHQIDFAWKAVRANASSSEIGGVAFSEEVAAMLETANANDRRILAWFDELHP